MILSKPKTLEEAWQLDDNDRISMADAIALCFRENDLEEGRAILANVKNMERARIKQREISGTVHQLLWLTIASVGAHKAWTSGYARTGKLRSRKIGNASTQSEKQQSWPRMV